MDKPRVGAEYDNFGATVRILKVLDKGRKVTVATVTSDSFGKEILIDHKVTHVSYLSHMRLRT
jgi:hypothetical protein